MRSKDTCQLTVRGWKKIFYAKSNHKRAEVVIVTSGKRDFKLKLLQETKRTLYDDKSVNLKDLTIINIYALSS